MKLICSVLLFAMTVAVVGCSGSSSTGSGATSKDKVGSAEPPKAPEIPK